jgi:hypothetical protein
MDVSGAIEGVLIERISLLSVLRVVVGSLIGSLARVVVLAVVSSIRSSTGSAARGRFIELNHSGLVAKTPRWSAIDPPAPQSKTVWKGRRGESGDETWRLDIRSRSQLKQKRP